MGEDLARLWRERHPSVPPVAHTFRGVFADRWVRFHSLPESKRYPESEDEYAIVLHRYNTVLDELFAGQEVFVVTSDWSPTADGTRRLSHPASGTAPGRRPVVDGARPVGPGPRVPHLLPFLRRPPAVAARLRRRPAAGRRGRGDRRRLPHRHRPAPHPPPVRRRRGRRPHHPRGTGPPARPSPRLAPQAPLRLLTPPASRRLPLPDADRQIGPSICRFYGVSLARICQLLGLTGCADSIRPQPGAAG